jgi:hypothetical protein
VTGAEVVGIRVPAAVGLLKFYSRECRDDHRLDAPPPAPPGIPASGERDGAQRNQPECHGHLLGTRTLPTRLHPRVAPWSRFGCSAVAPAGGHVGHDGCVKLKLDLHDLYNRGEEIERALRAVIDEAVAKKAPLVEIIPGKGSGQLKKRVLRFLDRKEIKALYHRVEKDSDNFGRIFVHFRWK